MLRRKVEDFEVLDLGVREEHSVAAQVRLGLCRRHQDVKRGVGRLLEVKGDLLEALSGKGSRRVGPVDLCSKDREELAGSCLASSGLSVLTGVRRVGSVRKVVLVEVGS